MEEKLLCNNKPVHYYSLNRNIFILARIKKLPTTYYEISIKYYRKRNRRKIKLIFLFIHEAKTPARYIYVPICKLHG